MDTDIQKIADTLNALGQVDYDEGCPLLLQIGDMLYRIDVIALPGDEE